MQVCLGSGCPVDEACRGLLASNFARSLHLIILMCLSQCYGCSLHVRPHFTRFFRGSRLDVAPNVCQVYRL